MSSDHPWFEHAKKATEAVRPYAGLLGGLLHLVSVIVSVVSGP